MTCSISKQIFRVVSVTVAILLVSGTGAFALQEKISPLSDYQYKRDFAQYEGIKKEADVQKRADLLLAFIKEKPISRILLYAVTDYMECLKSEKDTAKLITLQESLLTIIPTQQKVQEAGIPVGVDEFIKDQLTPSQKLILSSLVQAYLQSNNLPKGAETAEKLYAMNPDRGILQLLANIYLGMKNYDKYMGYAQKLMADTPMEQGYSMALQMAQVYLQKQDIPAATELLTKILEVYGDKVPPNVQEAQWNATRAFAYGVLASGVYGQKDYTKALELYEKVAKFDPSRDDAHYYIGMSKWQNKDPEGAIEAFAKCAVLNKNLSKKAQGYLEDLYKARHNDSLDGLDQVLGKAKADLGLN